MSSKFINNEKDARVYFNMLIMMKNIGMIGMIGWCGIAPEDSTGERRWLLTTFDK